MTSYRAALYTQAKWLVELSLPLAMPAVKLWAVLKQLGVHTEEGIQNSKQQTSVSMLTVAVLEMASIERAHASTLVQSLRLRWRLLYTEDAASGGTTLKQSHPCVRHQ